MAAEAPKPQITVLYKTYSEVPDAKGQMQPLTHIVYKDERGIIGTLTIRKKEPTDSDIKSEVLKIREAEKARKPHVITL